MLVCGWVGSVANWNLALLKSDRLYESYTCGTVSPGGKMA